MTVIERVVAGRTKRVVEFRPVTTMEAGELDDDMVGDDEDEIDYTGAPAAAAGTVDAAGVHGAAGGGVGCGVGEPHGDD